MPTLLSCRGPGGKPSSTSQARTKHLLPGVQGRVTALLLVLVFMLTPSVNRPGYRGGWLG
jgi:hypothetical protein